MHVSETCFAGDGELPTVPMDTAGTVWTPQGTGTTSFQQQVSQAAHARTATQTGGAARAAPTVPQPQAVQTQPTVAANPGLPQLPPLLPQAGNVFRADGSRGLPLPQQLPVPQGVGPHGPSFLQLLSVPLPNPANLGLPPLASSAPVLAPSSDTSAPAVPAGAARTLTAHDGKDGEPCATAEPLDPGVEALVKAVKTGQMSKAADLLALLHPPAAPPMGPASGEAPVMEPTPTEVLGKPAQPSNADVPSEVAREDALQLPKVADAGMPAHNVAFYDASASPDAMLNDAAEEAVPEGAVAAAEGESALSKPSDSPEQGMLGPKITPHPSEPVSLKSP